MSRILFKSLVFTFVVSLSGIYVSNALWACGGACGGSEHSSHEAGGHVVQAKAEKPGGKVEAEKDPVCGMEVIDIKKASSEKYKGKFYYFCAEHCKEKFKKDPASYVKPHQYDESECEEHKH